MAAPPPPPPPPPPASTTTTPDWSKTPTDVLTHILQHLPVAADRIRFAAVCLSFRAAAALPPLSPPSPIPWLMLPTSPARFLSLPERRSYLLPLPDLHHRRIIGSSQGYLVFVDPSAQLQIFNPITASLTPLPCITTLPGLLPGPAPATYTYHFPPPYPAMTYDIQHMREKFFTKVILSPGAALAAVIYRAPEKIAVARPGDAAWIAIQMPYMGFKDIIFHGNILYAVNYLGKVVACDMSEWGSPRVEAVAEGFAVALPPLKHISKYLVVSGGELLQVWRLVRRSRVDEHDEYGFCTRMWSVSRMSGNAWVEVKSIGDNALFLGQNGSVSLSMVDFPDLKRNCIYFTDDYNVGASAPHRGRDLGVYNLETQRIEPLWSSDSCLNWPPPVWFTPTLP